jgi:hypothetical protein
MNHQPERDMDLPFRKYKTIPTPDGFVAMCLYGENKDGYLCDSNGNHVFATHALAEIAIIKHMMVEYFSGENK